MFSVSVIAGISPSVVRSSEGMDAPSDRAQQLPLAVPLHRGDADDLARGHGQGCAPQRNAESALPGDVYTLQSHQ